MSTQTSSGFLHRCAATLLGLLLAALVPAPALAESELENGVKAAFLVRFGLYVEWPKAVFASPTSPLVLCIAGEDPFGEALDKAASEQRANDRPLVVRRVKAIGRDVGCHIAYLGGLEAQRPAQMAEVLRGSPVLTVSDAARGGATAAGIIHFVIHDNRVRFEIDDAAAARNGLAISSKLLGLALSAKHRDL
jgi:hypothetical protein